jgi:ABC-type nitrate/sulfonate/bicarbonate transport system permease component
MFNRIKRLRGYIVKAFFFGGKMMRRKISPGKVQGTSLQFAQETSLQAAPFLAIILLWQLLSMSRLVPGYMLPSPLRVVSAFMADFPLLMRHLGRTLLEAMAGLILAAIASFLLAIIMDANRLIKQSLTPLLLLTQTLPTIAIAPLLILWMGYGITPKIALVFLVCFFPMTIGLLGAFAGTDNDVINLMRSMGATRRQIYQYIKLPQGLPAFFSGLKIAGSYSIIGAVIAEWLGGDAGLGVYMIRVRRSYSFDKMFAVILLTSVLSILLIKLITIIEKNAMPWAKVK